MANQRLMVKFGGETFVLAKHFGGPDWRPSLGLERLCDAINEASKAPAPHEPLQLVYEHDPVDWLDPPLLHADLLREAVELLTNGIGRDGPEDLAEWRARAVKAIDMDLPAPRDSTE